MSDPDSIRLIVSAILFAATLVLCWRAGGAFSKTEDDKNRRPAIGFSDRAAGLACALVVCAALGCWLCLTALCAMGLALAAPVILLVLALAGVALFALGCARGKPGGGRLASVLGAVVCAPAKLVFKAAGLSAAPDLTEEEVMNFVDDVEEQDLIDENQKEMITNIFELDEVEAGQIMTHRTEIVSVPAKATAGEAVRLAMKEGVSRIPVYGENLDEVVGMLHVKDLFALWDDPERGSRPVTQFMREAMFVPESCRARALLVQFQHRHTQIAVVVDEYGGTAGLVTMEDILEEIVGDMQDEFDNEEAEITRRAAGVDAVGEADLEDVFDALGLSMPAPDDKDGDGEPDFVTVGGLLADKLGRIPAEGEHPQVEWGGVRFTVTGSDERHITDVHCEVLPKEAATEEKA